MRNLRLCLEALEDRCLLAGGFTLSALASDIPGKAAVTDPNLVNPWGISYNPTGFFWFSDNGAGVSDLADGNGQPQSLVVSVPGHATGNVFYGGSEFQVSANGVSGASRFLFATQDGRIFGWNSTVDPTHAVLAVDESASGDSYTGLALATNATGQSFLYAANLRGGTIDVFDSQFHSVALAGAFHDPNLRAGYTPFNIQNIDGRLFVTYTHLDRTGTDPSPWVGNGVVDVYDTSGNFLYRLASGGTLNAPWGLALAPADFGKYGGALLVGNNGDGHINAFDVNTGAFLGQLTDTSGNTLAISNLWGLSFGNGHQAGDENTLFFTAGIDNEQHGLFGAIRDPGAPVVFAPDPSYVPDPSDDEYPIPPNRLAVQATLEVSPTGPTVQLLAPTGSLVLIPTLTPVSQVVGDPSPITPSPLASGHEIGGQPTSGTSRLATLTDAAPVTTTEAVDLDVLLTVGTVQTSGVEFSDRLFLNTSVMTPGGDVASAGGTAAGSGALENPSRPAEESAPGASDEQGEPEAGPSWNRWMSLLGKVFLGSVVAAVGYHIVERVRGRKQESGVESPESENPPSDS
jgi:uncharacterized protein (TIGR03118 family)